MHVKVKCNWDDNCVDDETQTIHSHFALFGPSGSETVVTIFFMILLVPAGIILIIAGILCLCGQQEMAIVLLKYCCIVYCKLCEVFECIYSCGESLS